MAIVARHQPLERSRAGVYEQALRTLSHTLDFKRKNLKVAADSPLQGLTPDDKLDLLRRVAWAVQAEGKGLRANAISADRLRQEVRSFFADFGMTPIDSGRATKEMIQALQEQSWILTLRGPDLYGYVHRTFLEYLCADHILKRFEAQAIDIDRIFESYIRPHCDDDSWAEVIRRLAGQLGRKRGELAERVVSALNPDPGIGAGQGERPALAFECLAEQEAKQLETMGATIKALVVGFYRWMGSRSDCSPVETEWKLQERLAGTIDAIRVPGSVRNEFATFELRSIQSGFSRQPAIAATIGVFWPGTKETCDHVCGLAGSSDSSLKAVAQEAMAKYWRQDPRTLAVLREQAMTGHHRAGESCRLLAEFFRDDPGTLPLLRQRAVEDKSKSVRERALRLLPEDAREEVVAEQRRRRRTKASAKPDVTTARRPRRAAGRRPRSAPET